MPRLHVARRYQIAGALITLSALYWLGVWAWVRAEVEGLRAAGEPEVGLALRELSLVYPATWAWVSGVIVVHALVLAWAIGRQDHEARAGGLTSLTLHVLFAVSNGVIGSPG